METAGVCAVRRSIVYFEFIIMIFYFFVRAWVTFSLLNGMGEVCPLWYILLYCTGWSMAGTWLWNPFQVIQINKKTGNIGRHFRCSQWGGEAERGGATAECRSPWREGVWGRGESKFLPADKLLFLVNGSKNTAYWQFKIMRGMPPHPHSQIKKHGGRFRCVGYKQGKYPSQGFYLAFQGSGV